MQSKIECDSLLFNQNKALPCFFNFLSHDCRFLFLFVLDYLNLQITM